MLLDKSDHSLYLVLGAAKTTNDCNFAVNWEDTIRDATHLESSIGKTNGVTQVAAAIAPPDNTARKIQELFVYNFDTVNQDVYVIKKIAGTDYIIKKATLTPKQTLTYQQLAGWQVN